MSAERKKKWILVDGHNLAFRCFYGIPTMARADGLHTNAIFGYIRALMRLESHHKPDAICVFFDTDGSAVRREVLSTYKANRKKMPNELATQLDWMKKASLALGHYVEASSGIEADDLIGSFARKIAENGELAYIASSDKDFVQCLSESIFQLLPPTSADRSSEWRLLDKSGVYAKFGVRQHQIIDYLSLTGDSADNIDGLPGVGPKTAAKWLSHFDSIESIYDNLSEIHPERFQKILLEGREMLLRNRRLIRLQDIADFKLPCAEIRPDFREIENLLGELELHSILRDLRAANQQTLL
ncbi:MAG: 5'-3' exonuclease, partial [Puniceicoccales bacterium]|nr:5'-3' exonuclease [Puniceicoccales bacterium]